jgi:hypothetical protein
MTEHPKLLPTRPDALLHQTDENRTCGQCGAVLNHQTEFHPYTFCVMKKADPRMVPWETFYELARTVGMDVSRYDPKRPPLVRDLDHLRAQARER